MLAADQPGLVDALLLLSYPLHPPQRPLELRTAHFPHLQTPALFVSGARDGFASTEELVAALKAIPARNELLTVPSAGHELLNKRNRDDHLGTTDARTRWWRGCLLANRLIQVAVSLAVGCSPSTRRRARPCAVAHLIRVLPRSTRSRFMRR